VTAPAPGSNHEIENAVFQWEEGYRSLEDARSEPARYRALARAVVAIQDELRKRLGSRFSVGELASLYRQGSDRHVELALAFSSADAGLIDPAVAADAAYYLYMREASDFAGGRAL
jgi:hypothetical protein